MKINNFLCSLCIVLLLLGSTKMNAQSIKKTFDTHTSDCVVEFDIAPTAPWQDINIRPATEGNDKNTRILLKGGGKVQLFNSKKIADNFTYKMDGTKYNFKVSLYFKNLKTPLVTVEAKEATADDWIVLFEKETQISKMPVGMLEVLGKKTAALHLSNVRIEKL